MTWNWLMQKCPWCGCLHDDGVLIQTENEDVTVYVCHDCAEDYYEEEDR